MFIVLPKIKCPKAAPNTVAKIKYACVQLVNSKERGGKPPYIVGHKDQHQEKGQEDCRAIQRCTEHTKQERHRGPSQRLHSVSITAFSAKTYPVDGILNIRRPVSRFASSSGLEFSQRKDMSAGTRTRTATPAPRTASRALAFAARNQCKRNPGVERL